MMKSDCRGCTERKVGCHSSCEVYARFKEKIDGINAKRQEERDINDGLLRRRKK